MKDFNGEVEFLTCEVTCEVTSQVTYPAILANMSADPKLAEIMAEGGVVGQPSMMILYPA